MAAILTEALTVGSSGDLAALPRPALHGLEIIVGAVVAAQPLSLAGMFGKHRALALKCRGNIHYEFRMDDAAFAVSPLERVHVIEVWNGIQDRRRQFAPRTIVRYRRSEACVPDQRAGSFVVAKIIHGRGCQDQLRPHFP